MPRPDIRQYATAESRRKGAFASHAARSEQAKTFRQKLAEKIDAKAEDVANVYFEAMEATRIGYVSKEGVAVTDDDHPTRVRAANSALDQAFGKPTERMELAHSGSLEVEHTRRLTLADVASLASELAPAQAAIEAGDDAER